MALTQISTAGVKDDAVTSGKIPTNAVGSSEIADDAVTQAHIATDAVVTANIVDDSVTYTKIQNIAQNEFMARQASGTGDVQSLNAGEVRSILNVADGATNTAINNNADNRVITGSGSANSLEAEPNLTFDNTNSKLTVGSGGVIQSTSSSGNLAIGGGNTNPGGQILFKGGNSDANIVFKAQTGTATPAERMRIDASGRVMIGTTSVSPANSYSNNLVVSEASGDAGISIHGNNSNSNYSSLYLGDAGAASRSYFEAQLGSGTSKSFTIGTEGRTRFLNAGVERMRIDESGRVGIGTTSPAHKLDLDNGSARFNRGNSSGDILVLRGQNADQFRFDTDGLKFGTDTAAANALYDYEEGNFDPIMYEGQGSQQINYTWRHGGYVKIGSIVHIMLSFGIASFNTSGWNRSTITVPFNTAQNHAPFDNDNFSYIDLHGYSYLGGYGDGGGQNGGDNGGLYLQIAQAHSNRMEIVYGRDKAYAGVNQLAAGQRVAIQFSYYTS